MQMANLDLKLWEMARPEVHTGGVLWNVFFSYSAFENYSLTKFLMSAVSDWWTCIVGKTL